MDMKKKIILFVGIILILGMCAVSYGALIGDSSRIQVTLISQEPDPAEPGQVVDVRFKVENLGGGGTDDIIFEIMPEYPFSLYNGEAVRNIGSMQAYQNGEEGIIILYRLRVDENAIEGDNKINIRYKFGEVTSKWTYIKDFVIRIRTADIVLLIEDIKSIPEIIPPGEKAKLQLNIKNTADSLIRNLNVKIDLSSSAIPFVPIGSTAEKMIYQIGAGEEKILTFDIMAMSDADSKAYKIPINISYSDEAGTAYSKDDIISLIIGGKPDLAVNIDSSEVYGKNMAGNIVVKITNKGLTNVKLLNLKLMESEDYDIISTAESYIGNIDSDDYETVDFNIYVKNDRESIKIPLNMEYLDANNKQYDETRDLELKLYSSSQAKKYGITAQSSVGFFIIMIIVIGGLGIYFWRRRNKKKKKTT